MDDATKLSIIETLSVTPLTKVSDSNVMILDSNLVAQRNQLESIASEHEFQLLDLTPFLIDAVEKGQSPYFFSDTHFNQVGHDITRQALIKFLSESPLD